MDEDRDEYWDRIVAIIRYHFPGALALRVTTYLPDGAAIDFEDFRPIEVVHVSEDGHTFTEVPLPFDPN